MYTGLTAKLTIGENTVGYISNWSVEETRDTIEVTQIGQKNKEIYPTLCYWTASAEGTADYASDGSQKALRDAMIGGQAVQVKFYLNETDYFSGTAYVTAFSTDISAEDKGNVSISLTGSGALTLTSVAGQAE